MDATPLEHAGELAVATKCTGEFAVALPEIGTVALVGDETNTPAKDGKENDSNTHTTAQSFPTVITKSPAFSYCCFLIEQLRWGDCK
jgi:hypothetical protein